jgi:hypothetical protein
MKRWSVAWYSRQVSRTILLIKELLSCFCLIGLYPDFIMSITGLIIWPPDVNSNWLSSDAMQVLLCQMSCWAE